MRFRIPLAFKETVEVFRASAYSRADVSSIATDVKCSIMPGRDLVTFDDRVPVRASALYSTVSNWVAILEKPNPHIASGDTLRRADGTTLKVFGVRPFGTAMVLDVNPEAVP